MNTTKRVAATVSVGAFALLGALATPVSAVPDPVAAITCLTQAAGDVTTLVDPSAPDLPAELPGTNCLSL
ncbi:hypothetical protein [Streptomyces flaveolus]|uniref:hypothetical protein n=1 Tax=Streptomyces flaveolus TaxID=67297 RepID=UPI0036F58EAD